MSTSTCPLVKEPVKLEMLRHFLFSFFKIASFRETKVCYIWQDLWIFFHCWLVFGACKCMPYNLGIRMQFQHQNQDPPKMQGNAGKHDLNFRAPHHIATALRPSRRIVSAPAHVSPDPTPRLSQVLWEAFGCNYLGLNIFVGVEFKISPSILGLSVYFGVASISPTSTSR